ncbi:MAG: sensor histidine kinase [Bacteroidota bacterium]
MLKVNFYSIPYAFLFLLTVCLQLPTHTYSQDPYVDSLLQQAEIHKNNKDTFNWSQDIYHAYDYALARKLDFPPEIRDLYLRLGREYGFRVDDWEDYPAAINPINNIQEVYYQVQILEEADPLWTYEEIREKEFLPNTSYPNLNPDTVHWMKLEVHGSKKQKGEYFFLNNLNLSAVEYVDIYYESQDSLHHLEAGFAQPNKQIPGAINFFGLVLDKNEVVTLFIRTEGRSIYYTPNQLQLFYAPHAQAVNFTHFTFDGVYGHERNSYTNFQQLVNFLSLAEDTSGNLELEEAKQLFDKEYLPNGGHHFKKDGVYWGKIKFLGSDQYYGPHLFQIGQFSTQGFEKIKIFYPKEDGSYEIINTGSAIANSKRYRKQRQDLFELNIPPNDTLEVYFRFEKAKRRFQVDRPLTPIQFIQLDRAKYWEGIAVSNYRFGILIGSVGILFFYFFLFFIIERSKLYLYFSLVVLAAFLKSFPESPFFPVSMDEKTFVFVNSLTLILVVVSIYLFSFEFLQLKSLKIRIAKVLPYILILFLLYNIFLVFVQFSSPDSILLAINVFMTFILLVFIFIAAISAYRKGHKPAIYFIIAFTCLLVLLLLVFLISSFNNQLLNDQQFTIFAYMAVFTIPLFIAMGMGQYAKNIRQEKTNAEIAKEAASAKALAAEEANEAKSSFLNTVSHELRTPLTSILGFARLNKRNMEQKVIPEIKPDSSKAQKAAKKVSNNLDIITSEGERLTKLINELLDLAKIESGKVDWNMEDTNPAELIKRATTATSALFSQKPELQLIQEIPEDLPQVHVDKDRMIQVLINLISNAVKFTESGHVKLGITQQKDITGSQDQKIKVYIEDTGSGIPPSQIEKIFERFQQVEDNQAGKPKGTGLGLPICKEIVEHHGGEIWAESDGKGSTFYFTIPTATE